MKIFAANYVPRDEFSGSSGHIIQWAKAMKEKGHDVDLFFGDDSTPIKPLNKIHSAPHILWAFPLKVAWKLLRSKKDYDVIQITDVDGWLAWPLISIFGKHKKAVKVLKMQGVLQHRFSMLVEEAKRGHGRVRWRNHLYLTLTRFWPMRIVRWFTHSVVAASKADLELMQNYYGFEDDQLHYLPQGIRQNYLKSTAPKRQSHKILFVGGWHSSKGIYYLVEALENLKDIDWTCTLAGTGQEKESVLEMFSEPIRDRFTVIPSIEPESLQKEYESANCFVLPTLCDVLANVLLEAAACGCPIISTNKFGTIDVFSDGDSATLIPPRDSQALSKSIRSHLENPENFFNSAIKAKKNIAHLTWLHMAENYETLVKSHHHE